MADEAKLKDQIARGAEAERWLNHPLYRQAIVEIKAELFNRFEKSKYKEADDREEVWRKIQSLNAIVARMERHVRTGENANRTLMQRLKDRITRSNP
jgi:hypothetical protein